MTVRIRLCVTAWLLVTVSFVASASWIGCSSTKNNNVASEDAGDGLPTADSGPLPDAGAGLPQLASPTFSPEGGSSLQAGATVSISLPPQSPAGAVIFYTLDGALPTCTPDLNCTGIGYVGPIQLSTAGTTTVWAVSAAAGYAPSAPSSATFTVTSVAVDGGVGAPTITPTAGIMYNDFLATISGAGSGTVCYRLDGNSPTCSAGVCTGGSVTYNASIAIAISGTVTDLTGGVTLSALSCNAAGDVSVVRSQTYRLQVAVPSAADPAPPPSGGALPYSQNIAPTFSTAPTVASISPANSAQVFYTTDGTTPSCAAGASIYSPGQVAAFDSSRTFEAVGCKTGYAPSSVATFVYTVAAPTDAGEDAPPPPSDGGADGASPPASDGGVDAPAPPPSDGGVGDADAHTGVAADATTTYAVTYNANGASSGAVPVDSTAYASGAKVTVLGNIGGLVNAGLSLVGWNTAANGTGTSYAVGSTFSIASNVTLYAEWAAKTIFVTTLTYTGNLGGISGADLKCMGDTQAAGGTYKALLVDGQTRIACTSGSACTAAQNVGWVLVPNTTYARPSGTQIGTTNAAGVFPFALTAAIGASSGAVITGLDTNWTPNAYDCNGGSTWTAGDEECNCDNFTSGTDGYYASYGAASSTSSSSIGGNVNSCSYAGALYCVEQ